MRTPEVVPMLQVTVECEVNADSGMALPFTLFPSLGYTFYSMNSSGEPIIEVKGLTKKYGSFTAVDNISLSVRRGETLGILGPNGAGKTTTIEMIEGLKSPTAGSIMLDGKDVARETDAVKAVIGVQLQSSSFFDGLNLLELIETFAALYDNKVDPMAMLAEVELTDKAKAQAKELSGGQRQRLSVAIALVNDPKVLFLDEPTTGLDPQARRHLWDLVQKIKAKGKTIILTTHYMDEAEVLCDRIAIMDHGKIIELDTPQALIQKLLATGFSKEVVRQQANLEDVFLHFTGHALRD
jgi:ABC-2 type transport system ATP-binding protein